MLGKFARTETEPSIYWLPANGNEETAKCVEKSRLEMEEKVEEERKRVESRIEELKAQFVEIANRFEVPKAMEEEKKEEKKKEVDSHLLDIGGDSEGEMEEETKKEEGKEM